MTKREVNIQYIADNVVDLFGEDNLAAAFITGSVASGYGSDNCDVDILICHYDAVDTIRRENFTEFYLDLHEKLRRIPDEVSPGEVMSVNEMKKGLSRVGAMEPARVVIDRDDFDYVCWAGMLVSKKELLIPRNRQLVEFEGEAVKVIDRWAIKLFGDMVLTYGTGLNSDKDKMLARVMSCPGYYDAHE
jgi:predicted nucleotidyltransferase